MPPSVTTKGKPIKNRLRNTARIALPAGVTPQLSGQAVATTSWEGAHPAPCRGSRAGSGTAGREHSWVRVQKGSAHIWVSTGMGGWAQVDNGVYLGDGTHLDKGVPGDHNLDKQTRLGETATGRAHSHAGVHIWMRRGSSLAGVHIWVMA